MDIETAWEKLDIAAFALTEMCDPTDIHYAAHTDAARAFGLAVLEAAHDGRHNGPCPYQDCTYHNDLRAKIEALGKEPDMTARTSRTEGI